MYFIPPTAALQRMLSTKMLRVINGNYHAWLLDILAVLSKLLYLGAKLVIQRARRDWLSEAIAMYTPRTH